MGRLLKEIDSRARVLRGAESVLRQAVECRWAGTDAQDSVHRSLRSLCRVARTHGIHVEQLVVACKDAWSTLPQARDLPLDVGTELLKSVIAQCIDQFYRTDAADYAPSELSRSPAVPDSSLSFMLGPLS